MTDLSHKNTRYPVKFDFKRSKKIFTTRNNWFGISEIIL